MVKNHNLARSISDVSWAGFNRILDYKALWQGKNILRLDRFEPSSKLCFCGTINEKLTLKDRVWTCHKCKSEHDRDIPVFLPGYDVEDITDIPKHIEYCNMFVIMVFDNDYNLVGETLMPEGVYDPMMKFIVRDGL